MFVCDRKRVSDTTVTRFAGDYPTTWVSALLKGVVGVKVMRAGKLHGKKYGGGARMPAGDVKFRRKPGTKTGPKAVYLLEWLRRSANQVRAPYKRPRPRASDAHKVFGRVLHSLILLTFEKKP